MTSRINNPFVRQSADQVNEYQDPAVWLESKCRVLTAEEYMAIRANQTNNSTFPRVLLDEGYIWEARDYVQAPFALLIGALNALPTASFGFKCSKNTTSARNSLLEAFDYFNSTQEFDGVQSLYDTLSYFDEIGSFCYWSFKTELTEAHFNKLFT
jgi:hypothetical protein